MLTEFLPKTIYFPATAEHWEVRYQQGLQKTKLIAARAGHLIIDGPPELSTIQLLLKKWLRIQAKEMLFPMVRSLSKITDLPFQSLSIGYQRSQWGSCNAEKAISLNALLVFLQKPLIEYVIIHELCHTRYLNHSPDFWRLVRRFDYHYVVHKKMLKTVENDLPIWIKV